MGGAAAGLPVLIFLIAFYLFPLVLSAALGWRLGARLARGRLAFGAVVASRVCLVLVTVLFYAPHVANFGDILAGRLNYDWSNVLDALAFPFGAAGFGAAFGWASDYQVARFDRLFGPDRDRDK